MAIYENFIITSKLNEVLDTKLSARSYMTIDDTLAMGAGMVKKVNNYTLTSSVEDVVEGATNANRGSIAMITTPYEVAVSQSVYDVTDEQAMQDPGIIDMIIAGAADEMVNDLTTKFFAELAKTSIGTTYAKNGHLSYATIVAALDELDLENEDDLVLFVDSALRSDIRSDTDFKAANQGALLFSGQIGTIAGIPVVHSKACPAGCAYVASKTAVTLFIKKDSETETARDAEHRKDTYIFRKVHLVGLTNGTKVCEITEALA